VVETTKGRVRGFVAEAPVSKIRIANFRGIPYAAPPVGKNRFKHPKDCHPWKPDILNCYYFGYRSVQNPNFGTEIPLHPFGAIVVQTLIRYLFAWGNNRNPADPQPIDPHQSENCLTLNVIKPAEHREKLPVNVFFHGGAFELGHSSEELYANEWGHPFAEKGVLYVSANYRLGVLGYLKVEDGDYNNGLADQIKALRWVQQEIANFGGDPDNVTIMGHSAGAFSCGALIASPKTHGLFHRAILMSGAAANALSKLENDKVGEAFAEALGVRELSVSSLERFDLAHILAAQLQITQTVGPLPFQPTVDNDLLVDFPGKSLMHGAAKDIDLMIGCTREEAKLFHNLVVIAPFSRWSMIKFLTPFVSMLGLHGSSQECQELTEKMASVYIDWHLKGRPEDCLTRGDFAELFFKFVSEFVFDAPASLLCEAHAEMRLEGKRTYRYRFDYKGPMGAVHGIDLPFLFGTYEKWKNLLLLQRFLGRDLSHPIYSTLAQSMVGAWTSFIRTGDPNCAELGKAHWPEFTHEKREMFLFGLDGHGISVAKSKDHRDDDPAFELMVKHRSLSDCAFGVFRD